VLRSYFRVHKIMKTLNLEEAVMDSFMVLITLNRNEDETGSSEHKH